MASSCEVAQGVACGPDAFAWTPHKAKRMTTARAEMERAASVKVMLSGCGTCMWNIIGDSEW